MERMIMKGWGNFGKKGKYIELRVILGVLKRNGISIWKRLGVVSIRVLILVGCYHLLCIWMIQWMCWMIFQF